jgi:hypothetical protein
MARPITLDFDVSDEAVQERASLDLCRACEGELDMDYLERSRFCSDRCAKRFRLVCERAGEEHVALPWRP